MNRVSLLMIASVILLTGCEPRQPDPVESRIRKVYEIVNINRPKHFRVDIKDVETGRVYKNKGISKHCNHWQKLKVGSRWYFTEVIYQGKDMRYVEIEGVRSLCEAIKSL
jgi:hypothetical protein